MKPVGAYEEKAVLGSQHGILDFITNLKGFMQH